jgi:hypothetical protein
VPLIWFLGSPLQAALRHSMQSEGLWIMGPMTCPLSSILRDTSIKCRQQLKPLVNMLIGCSTQGTVMCNLKALHC